MPWAEPRAGDVSCLLSRLRVPALWPVGHDQISSQAYLACKVPAHWLRRLWHLLITKVLIGLIIYRVTTGSGTMSCCLSSVEMSVYITLCQHCLCNRKKWHILRRNMSGGIWFSLRLKSVTGGWYICPAAQVNSVPEFWVNHGKWYRILYILYIVIWYSSIRKYYILNYAIYIVLVITIPEKIIVFSNKNWNSPKKYLSFIYFPLYLCLFI